MDKRADGLEVGKTRRSGRELDVVKGQLVQTKEGEKQRKPRVLESLMGLHTPYSFAVP